MAIGIPCLGKVMPFFVRSVALILAVLLSHGIALGQSLTQSEFDTESAFFLNDVAGKRQFPDYTPTGVRVGDFVVHPSLDLRSGYDSNIFNRPSSTQPDAFITVKPKLDIVSDWGRHSYTLNAEADFKRYAAIGIQNTNTYLVKSSAVVDLTAGTRLLPNFQFGRQAEPAAAFGQQLIIGGPSLYDVFGSGLHARADLGRLRLDGGADVERHIFLPVASSAGSTPLSQDFRNTTSSTVSIDVTYNFTPSIEAFAQAKGVFSRSLNAPVVEQRDSEGGTALVGGRLGLDHKLALELGMGYLLRNYKQPIYQDFDGLTYDVKLDYYPSSLVSVRLSADRTIVPSAIPSVAGILTNNYALNAYYEALRNVNVTLVAEQTHENYREIGVTDDLKILKMEIRWTINQYLSCDISGGWRKRSTSDTKIISNYNGFNMYLSVFFSL